MPKPKNPSWPKGLQKDGEPSNGMRPASAPDRLERRAQMRFERTKLESHTEHIFVRVKEKKRIIQSEVLDLSLQGVCFRARPALDFLHVGSTINIVLLLGEREHSLTVKIVNSRGPYVGCRIVESSPDWANEVAGYLEPLETGQRLYELRPRAVPDGDPWSGLRWFRSGSSCDLFCWFGSDDKLSKAQLIYDGQVVEWTPAYGFRSGQIVTPPANKADEGSSAYKFYDLQLPADRKLLAVARRVILAARIPESIRKIFAK